MEIKNQRDLENWAEDMARDAIAEHGADEDSAMEWIHESVDGCEHVIYTYRATQICANCDTDAGEDRAESIYGKPFDGCDSYAEVVTRLAFFTLLDAVESAYQKLAAEIDDDESAD